MQTLKNYENHKKFISKIAMLLCVITHSSIAILLMWLMKPNVFELHAPISISHISTYSSLITYGTYNLIWDFQHAIGCMGGLAQGCEPRGVSEGYEESPCGMKGAMLDFTLAGAVGTYTLVKDLKNAALNKAMDKLIEEADAMKAMTLEQCQQG